MVVISSGEFSKQLSINFKKSMRSRGFLHGILNLLEYGSRKVGLRRSYASFQPRQSVTQSYMRVGRISSDDPPLCVDSNQTRWDAIFPVFKPRYQPPSSVPPKGNNFKLFGGSPIRRWLYLNSAHFSWCDRDLAGLQIPDPAVPRNFYLARCLIDSAFEKAKSA